MSHLTGKSTGAPRPNKKRTAAIASTVAVAALALSGCVATGDGTAGSAEELDFSGVEPATELTFWSNHPGGSIELEKEIISRFEEETGIKVEMVTAGANYEEVSQKFQTAQTSGQVGDLVVLSDATWFPAFLAQSIIPIDEAMKAVGVETADYQKTLFNDYEYDGSHYGVPYARSTPIFYYNKDHYAEAGLPVDEAPATWDDVKDYSMKLKEAGINADGFGYPEESEYPAWTMANLVWGYDGAWSDKWNFDTVNNENTVEAITFAKDAVTDGWAAVLTGDPATSFSAGGVSQVIASTGSLRGILDSAQFDVGVGFLPAGPKVSENIVPTGGAGLAIAAKSSPEKQLAAAKFAAFLTNPENTAFFAEGTGYLPVQPSADMTAVYEEIPQYKAAVEQLPLTRSQDYARVFVPGGDLTLSKALQSILAGGADVQTTLDQVRDDLQRLYDRDLAGILDSGE